MFQTIIVPLDASLHAEAALPYAIDEARRHGAMLVLLHVVPRPEPPVPPPRVQLGGPTIRPPSWPERDVANAAEAACGYLDRVVRQYLLPPGTVSRVVVGEPSKRVIAEARAWPGALVVMTTGDCAAHPRPALSEVARQVLLSGTVPVLGIRHDAAPSEDVMRGSFGVCMTAPALAER
ncbi:MAG TPA: universal stress protein [Thermomicrobiales bacterium]|nr:universal stress protein [Thermomicrobiales bacterium]